MQQTNTSEQELRVRLVAIQKLGKSYEMQKKKTRDTEREFIVKAYLWWRDASKQIGYLEDIYDERCYPNNKLSPAINFTPLLRLSTDDTMTDDDMSHWHQALNDIHAEFEANNSTYAAAPVKTLMHYIKQNSGKTGLSTKWANRNEKNEITTGAGGLSQSVLNSEEFLVTFVAEAKTYFDSIGNLPLVETPTLLSNTTGYSTILVKNGQSGVEMVGSIADPVFTDQALISMYRTDFNVVIPALRSILETLHILNIPIGASKDSERFSEYSRYSDPLDETKKIKKTNRLVYKAADNYFLHSQIMADTCPVVRAYPLIEVFEPNTPDIKLLGATQQWIEITLLREQLFNIYKPLSSSKFKKTNKWAWSLYTLALENRHLIEDEDGVDEDTIRRHTRNLQHKSISWDAFYSIYGRPEWQADFEFEKYFPIDSNESDESWTSDVDIEWLRKLSSGFLQGWIAKYAAKFKREENITFKIKLDQQITISFEYSTTFSKHVTDKPYTLSSPNTKGCTELCVRSIDFAFIIRQIADLPIKGRVIMHANQMGICLTFATSVNAYQCFIPSSDFKGKRSDKGFIQHFPSITDDGLLHLTLPNDDGTNPAFDEISTTDTDKKIEINLARVRAKK